MSQARIYETGYRRYEGVRGGPRTAVRSLALHSFKQLLGIRRRVWAKLLTVVVAAFAYLPAVVFLGFAVFVPREITDLLLPGSAQYLGFVIVPVYLFVALAAPSVLCPDRRHGTLALYLASPLTRDTYLVAKAAAVATFLAIVTIGPALLLIVGLSLVDAGPQGVAEVASEIGRAFASGLVVTGLFGGLSLAIASLTDRQGAASGFVVLWLLASGTFVGVARTTLDASGVVLLDVTRVAFEATLRIYGERGNHPDVPTAAVLLAAAAWIAGTAVFVRWRYQHLQVTR